MPATMHPAVPTPSLPNPFYSAGAQAPQYAAQPQGAAPHHGYSSAPYDAAPAPRQYEYPAGSYAYGANTQSSGFQHNRKRRGNLPKEATKVLRQWFDDHSESPYPTEEDKTSLCQGTGLQMTQVRDSIPTPKSQSHRV